MTATSRAESYLPLKPVVLHILLVLSANRAHGYEIMQTVADKSGGTVEISTAVLYRTLSRLLRQGLVSETDRRPKPDEDDSRRRYYQITPLGRRVLTLELARLREVLASSPASSLLRTVDGA